jgi:hypothetical protein
LRIPGFLLALCLSAQTATAAPVAQTPEAFPRGEAIAQRFLPSGASVVTTAAGSTCVVSRKIEIAQSSYVNPDGTAVAFATIRRSVAASVQAMGGQAGGPADFRIQMKYALAPGRPVWLTPGDGQGRIDIAALREPSGDSLHLTGDVAARLAAAMAAGQGARLEAWSADTGRDVSDTLPLLDMAALADCRATLDAGNTDPGPQANYLTVAFDAAPTADTRATVDEMRACAMAPTDRPVHEGRLTKATGFFAQTDKVFVAFDEAGKPAQVYVPGVFDAGFDANGVGEARVSIAADSNAPAAENTVKGCLGAAAAQMCRYPDEDGTGWVLHPCGMMPGAPGGPTILGPAGIPTSSTGPGPAGLTALVPPGSSSVPPSSLIIDSNDDDEEGEPDPASLIVKVSGPPDPPPPPPPPPPIPLPAAGWLLLTAIGGLAVMRRRRG